MVDVRRLKSHPDKFLFEHVDGVVKNVKKLTNLKIAELVAMFHDLGKINPNFQKKLKGEIVNGYANHAYLSAFAFLGAFGLSLKNKEILTNWLGKKITQNDLIALITVIAKHHRNLPDLSPKDITGTGASILSKEENEKMFIFLNSEKNIPIDRFAKNYFPTLYNFHSHLLISYNQRGFKEQFIFNPNVNKNPLDFFLETQFSFASLIQADKVDAAKFDNFIDVNKSNVSHFCRNYSNTLNSYLSNLKQDTELNKLRTRIRVEAVNNIKGGLKENKRIFELTAPTGSGKTLMLLSLASEIIQQKGDKRIIYSLPFLSITEQVEAEVLKIFKSQKQLIQRIDSKSQNKNFVELQNKLDANPTKEIMKKINLIEFSENTFSYPFVITTFVQFFETLLSNKNSELIKLPNFSKTVFLIDEIQALPPRLYVFLTAYLTIFCEKFDSYAIISTATQPNFNLPAKPLNVAQNAYHFFNNYKKPFVLLPLDYFQHELFNRYRIRIDKEGTDILELKYKIIESKQSILVILNTIDDTKDLYSLLIEDKLPKEEVILLNTHITPRHRKIKIYLAKRRLRQGQKVVLISTQLIEAGVDIDFPFLYRDLATISSIVQSAGRCNRNGEIKNKGIVNLIRFKKNGQYRANLIYRGKDKDLLTFTTQSLLSDEYYEKNLLSVQKSFFDRIQNELKFATHSQKMPEYEFDFLKDIKEAQFNKIGQFHLIDKGIFGEEIQYYVPKNSEDESFKLLNDSIDELSVILGSYKKDWDVIKIKKNRIKTLRKKMSENIVQIRLKKNQIKPIYTNITKDGELFEIAFSSYSFSEGVDLKGQNILL